MSLIRLWSNREEQHTCRSLLLEKARRRISVSQITPNCGDGPTKDAARSFCGLISSDNILDCVDWGAQPSRGPCLLWERTIETSYLLDKNRKRFFLVENFWIQTSFLRVLRNCSCSSIANWICPPPPIPVFFTCDRWGSEPIFSKMFGNSKTKFSRGTRRVLCHERLQFPCCSLMSLVFEEPYMQCRLLAVLPEMTQNRYWVLIAISIPLQWSGSKTWVWRFGQWGRWPRLWRWTGRRGRALPRLSPTQWRSWRQKTRGSFRYTSSPPPAPAVSWKRQTNGNQNFQSLQLHAIQCIFAPRKRHQSTRTGLLWKNRCGWREAEVNGWKSTGAKTRKTWRVFVQ